MFENMQVLIIGSLLFLANQDPTQVFIIKALTIVFMDFGSVALIFFPMMYNFHILGRSGLSSNPDATTTSGTTVSDSVNTMNNSEEGEPYKVHAQE